MSICKFKQAGACEILTELNGRPLMLSDLWCAKHCRPNDPDRGYLKSTLERKKEMNRERQEKRKAVAAQIEMAVDELPSALGMIRNLGKHALTVVSHYKKTGRVFVNEYQQAERLEVCEACEHYKVDNSGHPRCKQASCGCHLSGELGKTRFEALPCPIGKHKTIDSNYNKD